MGVDRMESESNLGLMGASEGSFDIVVFSVIIFINMEDIFIYSVFFVSQMI